MMLGRTVTLAVVAASFLGNVAFSATCMPDKVSLRNNGSVASFTVEIADTDALRSSGLMFRENMPRFSGMLFIYDEPQPVYFWMKNTPLPLDMLFIDKTGLVTTIQKDAVPFSEKVLPGGNDILMVLEVNAGTSDMLGLTEGTQVQTPTLDQSTAIWPCDPE